MKYLSSILLFISISICSQIMEDTLNEIKKVFPESISITHSKYKISEEFAKTIQNNIKQKFFRPEVNLWIITNKDSLKYYGVLDNVKGKSMPITFLAIFNHSAAIYHSAIIKYREPYGGEIKNRNWLNQFIAYTDSSKYKIGDDISGITGATISVHSVTKGIRKLTYLIKEIIKYNE